MCQVQSEFIYVYTSNYIMHVILKLITLFYSTKKIETNMPLFSSCCKAYFSLSTILISLVYKSKHYLKVISLNIFWKHFSINWSIFLLLYPNMLKYFHLKK